MNDDISSYISAVLAEDLDGDSSALSEDTVLGASGLGLESLDLLHLIYSISDEFGIEIADDLGLYQSMTLGVLAAEVAAQIAGRPSTIAKADNAVPGSASH